MYSEYKVICDKTNNTEKDIKNNCMNVDIIIKVKRSIDFSIIIPKDKNKLPYIKSINGER